MKYSIVYKNSISKESSANRIDAEFFLPEILYDINLVKKHKCDKLGNLLKVLTDYHANGSYELLKEHVQMSKTKDYSLMIRTVDFENDNFENDVMYISKNAYEFLEKTKLFGYEVIINKIGNAGKTYLMPKLNIPVSLGMNVFMLKFNSIEFNTFVYVYLNTKYGKSIIERRVTGAVPLSIDKESIREILIPLYSDRLYRLIYLLIEKNFNYNKESKKIFNETKNILLSKLRLYSENCISKQIFIKNYSDIKNVNRFDAEYFQPKYDEIIEKIKSCPCGWDKLSNIIIPKKGIEVGSEEYCKKGIPFVRVSNLSQHEINYSNMQYISEKFYDSIADIYQPKKGEILLSKDGTLGIAYYLDETPPKMIPSGGIVRLSLHSNEYLPEYLTLVLNSIIVQMQVERVSSGALIKHWLLEEIQNTLIPKLEMDKQIEIVEQLNEATKLRKQSKQLLEIAKRGVEIAIEENEDIATSWIDERLLKIGVKL